MAYGAVSGVLNPSDLGPSDCGNFYFCSREEAVSSIWQTGNITSRTNASVIDNRTVWFNIPARIGGYADQDHHAVVSLTFLNSMNQQVDTNIILGPVWTANRGSITFLLFRQTGGFVPVSARSFMMTVTMTRFVEYYNDGCLDDTGITFHL